MRNFAVFVLMVICSGLAAAQMEQKVFEVPNTEISASFAYQHASIETPGGGGPQDSAGLHGFSVDFSHYFLHGVGLTAEISHVSNDAIDPTGLGYARTSYLGGPTLRLHRYGFLLPSVHVLGGVDRDKLTVPIAGATLSFENTDFAIVGGGTLDGNLSRHLAVRIAQLDYLYTHHYGTGQSSFRYLGGLVLRF